MDVYDVAIIGGGLAGASACIELGNRKLNTILLEKGFEYRDKPCGDGVIPSAVALLKNFGLTDQEFSRMNGMEFRNFSLYGNSNEIIWSGELKNRPGWIIPRANLDQSLRNIAQSKAEVSYNSLVTAIDHVSNGRWKIAYSQQNVGRVIFAKAVIVATGALNRFSRTWGIDGSPKTAVAISSYAEIKDVQGLIFQFSEWCKSGYGWVFPIKDNLVNIGVCTIGENIKTIKQKGDAYIKNFNAASTKWRGGTGPVWSGLSTTRHNNAGIVSCGDAGGMVDPLTGEGITAALMSGRIAGTFVAGYLQDAMNVRHLIAYSSFIANYLSNRYFESIARLQWRRICSIQ